MAEWEVAKSEMAEREMAKWDRGGQKSLHRVFDYLVWTLKPLPRKGLKF